MKYSEISFLPPINATEADRLAEIEASIRENGWIGAPILVCDYGLVTGSHRLTALENISDDYSYVGGVLEEDVAEDVTDIINEYCERVGVSFETVRGDSLSYVFEGTWVETYKDQIEEW